MYLKDKFIIFSFLSMLLVILMPISVSKASVRINSNVKVINLEKARQLVKEKYGNLNDIDIILDDLTKTMERSKDNNFKNINTKNLIFKERSYIFLVMSSIAFSESTFRKNVIGSANEIGTYQILPSTAKFLIKENNFKIKNIKDLNNEKCTILAVNYFQKHLEDENGNLIKALSRYNGDRTMKYGRKVESVFRSIVKPI